MTVQGKEELGRHHFPSRTYVRELMVMSVDSFVYTSALGKYNNYLKKKKFSQKITIFHTKTFSNHKENITNFSFLDIILKLHKHLFYFIYKITILYYNLIYIYMS